MARNVARLDLLDAGDAESSSAAASTCSTEAPCREGSQRRLDEALGCVNVVCVAGQPIRREQTPRELLRIEDGRAPGVSLACASALLGDKTCSCCRRLGRATARASRRQVDLLLRLPRRKRRHPRGSEAFGAERLHVFDEGLPRSSGRGLCPDRRLGHLDDLGHPLHRVGPLEAEPASQLDAEAGPRRGKPAESWYVAQDRLTRRAPTCSPSAVWVMLATITCVCRCRSRAREVR